MRPIDEEAWIAATKEEIDSAPDTTARGDLFVQKILRERYQLSEDDSVNATDCAGGGDRGVDAVHVYPADDGQPPTAIAIQGKYGSASDGFSPYAEFCKFATAVSEGLDDGAPTGATQQCASVVKSGGLVTYEVATSGALSSTQERELEDVRVLARDRFGDGVLIETVTLRDVYRDVAGTQNEHGSVTLHCYGVSALPNVFVGAATLTDGYRMLREYAQLHGGSVDGIYDRNVRKWLGTRARSVNRGIAQTLQSDPEKFVAYNNGITIVCKSFDASGGQVRIHSPQIVNGCQTTRTLYDFMENHFAGMADRLQEDERAAPYRNAYLPFKLLAVDKLDDEMVKNITRFSNKQNAVRGRDFLTLEDDFRRLKEELERRGYYLEVQTGEYGVLQKSEQNRFPRSRLITAFDALRFFGAGVFGKPHTAFGRSVDFTPGGREFDEVMDGLTADDLLVPWLVAQDANRLGYSVGAKWHVVGEDHRNQTRYFFLYVFFRLLADILFDTPKLDGARRPEVYQRIFELKDQAKGAAVDSKTNGYEVLLRTADEFVATYMNLAKEQDWYSDRNAFLKREELLREDRLGMAGGTYYLKKPELKAAAAAATAQGK